MMTPEISSDHTIDICVQKPHHVSGIRSSSIRSLPAQTDLLGDRSDLDVAKTLLVQRFGEFSSNYRVFVVIAWEEELSIFRNSGRIEHQVAHDEDPLGREPFTGPRHSGGSHIDTVHKIHEMG